MDVIPIACPSRMIMLLLPDADSEGTEATAQSNRLNYSYVI